MNKPESLLIDAGVAVGLLIALLIVFLVDTGGATTGPKREDAKVIRPEPRPQRPLRLAITPKVYDDLGSLLKKLGKGFDNYAEIQNIDLKNINRLKEFDVAFLTCASSNVQDIRQNEALRDFVAQGGTLYVSDWRFDALRGAFPEYIDQAAMKPGRAGQDVKAQVLEPGLKEVFGPERVLHFESPGWKPAAFFRDKVTVGIQGTYQPDIPDVPEVKNAPLLVKFRHKKGTVIFTSFHNGRQDPGVAEKLMKQLVFNAVTARAEAELNQRVEAGGFSPTKSSLVSASADNPKVTKTYRNSKGGRLLFALAFNPEEGVKLRLRVKGPDGKITEHEDSSVFTIEVSNAPVGEWEYTVEALNLRNPNFPFTVTVAEPK